MDKHDKYEVVKQAWFEINEHLRNNKQDYIEYLKFSSKMYKQPYSDAVLVFQQNRNATKIAEYKKWGRLGRYVRRGSHGVAVFGKNHTCRYLYDVTQTGGKELPEMFHQAVDGQIDPHDVQIYLDKAVIEHSKQNVQAVEVQDNSADTISADVTQQDKKIEPSRIIGLAENQLRPAVPNSSTNSITDSSGVVKSEKTFAEQVDEALSGKIPFYTSLKVCDTPQILLDVGCEQMPMLYSQKHLKNAILPPDEKNHRHGLEIEQIKRLPELLSYPVMIIDSPNRKDSIIVVTAEVDKSDNPVIASIKPNGKGRYEVENVSSNFITSVYGRENFDRHLELELQADNILYINKQKSQELSSVLRLQFSQGLNNLDSKEPIRHAAFTDKQLALSVLNGSDISISELFKVVKHYDNDFYINHSEQKSQELFSVLGLQSSQGLNDLDSNVIIHQSRNIVKGMQQENNAEQLSFFENSTLEDTEVEIPFAVGDEIDYGERHYMISKIDKEKNTVTLLDYNTGWYPISHDEDLSMVIAEFEAVREKEIAGFVNIT
ncbi:MAG: hypothetical protein KH048_08080 [Ruminococcus bicirculans]|uniref:MuF-C-terminal domain-containing protein n=1 Tax=Ruminococcus bicirculans (ex Wegman et al. 2014) TaxID=1160721 RepID=UPI0026573E69|nr:hypothetical protein [Ruminococcus bicirculans (ex Wegman et al. 2014)]